MENCLNINCLPTGKSPKGLLPVFLLLLLAASAQAQTGYNKLFTNQASASYFVSVVPQGSAGNCMAMALVNDSSNMSETGIRIARIGGDGEILANNYFIIPGFPSEYIFPGEKAATRVNDNLFAFVGDKSKSGCCKIGFIILADSNGLVKKYQQIIPPYCIATDSFMFTSSVQFDSTNNQLLILGHRHCGLSYNPVLFKYDTSLNLIWDKLYLPVVHATNLMFHLQVDSSGYTLCGGALYSEELFYDYDCRAIMLHTDTAGNMDWSYSSPSANKRGIMTTMIRTADKGYVYSVMGEVYNRKPLGIYPSWYGKDIIVKLDSNRNEEWVKPFYKPYSPFGALVYHNKLIGQEQNNIYYLGADRDSIDVNDLNSFPTLAKFKLDGNESWRRRLYPPDTTSGNNAILYDMRFVYNKSIVLVGKYDNSKPSIPPPTQRGWAIRVDSNGCYGVGDTGCVALGIIPVIAASEGVRVYPNPTKDYVTIEGLAQNSSISLHNLMGQLVYSQIAQSSSAQLGLQGLANGVYILSIKNTDGSSYQYKVMKE